MADDIRPNRRRVTRRYLAFGGLCLLANLPVLGAACRARPDAEAVDAAQSASSMPVSSVSASNAASAGSGAAAPSPAASCEGLEMPFGREERLVWGATGTLRKTAGAFAIEMDTEIIFTSDKLGRAKSTKVGLVCANCTPADWATFDATLDPMVGSRVRARGIATPGWKGHPDAGTVPVAIGAQLSTQLADMLVFADGGSRPATDFLRQADAGATSDASTGSTAKPAKTK